MRCAWTGFIKILPLWLRENVDKFGFGILQELRLRLNHPPSLVTSKGNMSIQGNVSADDLRFVINMASRYSPWTATSLANGYLTAPGGHRIGVCGRIVTEKGIMTGFNSVTSVCIRISKDFPNIAKAIKGTTGSVLIIGRPGSGKTTLLRDLIRQEGNRGNGAVAVIDEREEIFPIVQGNYCFYVGEQVDVLSGCRKSQGIDTVLRSMSPTVIAVDEITAEEDCNALLHAGWCGVRLFATAHADSKQDLIKRSIYRPIVEKKLFDTLIVLAADKTWHEERLDL